MRRIVDLDCGVCEHLFYANHSEQERIESSALEDITGKCADCVKCWPDESVVLGALEDVLQPA